MIKNPSLRLEQTSTIYDKQCPVCARYNMEDASECWNCHFEFVAEKTEKRDVFSLAEKILVGLTLALVGVIFMLRYLVV